MYGKEALHSVYGTLIGVAALVSCLVMAVDSLVIAVGCTMCATNGTSLYTLNIINGVAAEVAAVDSSFSFRFNETKPRDPYTWSDPSNTSSSSATGGNATLHSLVVVSLASSYVGDATNSYIPRLVATLEDVDLIVFSQSLSVPIFAAALHLPLLLLMMIDPGAVPLELSNRTQVVALRDDQVGYLAGLVAGSQSRTGVVGFIGGPRISSIANMRAGFHDGVWTTCPSCSVWGTYVSSFSALAVDVSAAVNGLFSIATDNATQLDVVWAAAGTAGSAALPLMASRGTQCIGVDQDEYTTTFAVLQGTSIASRLLTSSVKRSDIATRAAVRSYLATGVFSTSVRLFGAEQNCITLAPCHESCSRWSDRSKTIANTAASRLANGLTRIDVDTNTGALVSRMAAIPTEARLLPLDSAQQVAFATASNAELGRYLQTTSLWGRVVLFDGRWTILRLYDPWLVTLEQVLVVTLPSPAPPRLGGGFLFQNVVIGSQSMALLHGGFQDGVVGSAAFLLYFDCGGFVGYCTHSAVWLRIATVTTYTSESSSSNSGQTQPPRLYLHAATDNTGTSRNTMYVAGGFDASGAPSLSIWRLFVEGALDDSHRPVHLALTWARLDGFPRPLLALPAALRTIAVCLWGSDEGYVAPAIQWNNSSSVASSSVSNAVGDGVLVVYGTSVLSPSNSTQRIASLWWAALLSVSSASNVTSSWSSAVVASADTGAANTTTNSSAMIDVPCMLWMDPTTVTVMFAGEGRKHVYLRPNSSTRRVSLESPRNLSSAVAAKAANSMVSCAIPLGGGAHPLSFTTLAAAGPSAAEGVTTVAEVLMVPIQASSTESLVSYLVPLVTCDAAHFLYRSNNTEYCLLCAMSTGHSLVGDDCIAQQDTASSSSSSESSNLTIAISVTASVVGFVVVAVLGLIMLLLLLRDRRARMPHARRERVPPPLKYPVVLVMVSFCQPVGAPRIRNVTAWSHNVRVARAAVSWLAVRHQCYEVRSVADSSLFACQSVENAATFAAQILKWAANAEPSTPPPPIVKTTSTVSWWSATWAAAVVGIRGVASRIGVIWPGTVSCRICIHSGRPSISDSVGGFAYSGRDVEITIAGRHLAEPGELLVSTTALASPQGATQEWLTALCDVTHGQAAHGQAAHGRGQLIRAPPGAAPRALLVSGNMFHFEAFRAASACAKQLTDPPSPQPTTIDHRSQLPPAPGSSPFPPTVPHDGPDGPAAEEVAVSPPSHSDDDADASDVHIDLPYFQPFEGEGGAVVDASVHPKGGGGREGEGETLGGTLELPPRDGEEGLEMVTLAFTNPAAVGDDLRLTVTVTAAPCDSLALDPIANIPDAHPLGQRLAYTSAGEQSQSQAGAGASGLPKRLQEGSSTSMPMPRSSGGRHVGAHGLEPMPHQTAQELLHFATWTLETIASGMSPRERKVLLSVLRRSGQLPPGNEAEDDSSLDEEAFVQTSSGPTGGVGDGSRTTSAVRSSTGDSTSRAAVALLQYVDVDELHELLAELSSMSRSQRR